jgi:hypothetical protein
MPSRTSRAYTARHYQDVAALLAAERAEHGASPALNRIIAATARLFAEDSTSFSRELFGHAARGEVAPATRPRRRSGQSEAEHVHTFDGQVLRHSHAGYDLNRGYYEHPEDASSGRVTGNEGVQS